MVISMSWDTTEDRETINSKQVFCDVFCSKGIWTRWIKAHKISVIGINRQKCVARNPRDCDVSILLCFQSQMKDSTGLDDSRQYDFDLGPFQLEEGRFIRKFLAVPDGATWATVTLHFEGKTGTKVYYVALQQLVPTTHSEQYHVRDSIVRDAGRTYSTDYQVVSGFPLEIVIQQRWTSLGESFVTMDIQFHGKVSEIIKKIVSNEIGYASEEGTDSYLSVASTFAGRERSTMLGAAPVFAISCFPQPWWKLCFIFLQHENRIVFIPWKKNCGNNCRLNGREWCKWGYRKFPLTKSRILQLHAQTSLHLRVIRM